MKLDHLYDHFSGPCIREISSPAQAVYLTFDDGPDPEFTPAVLTLLKKYKAKATFFLIGKKADEHYSIVQQMLSEGHALGDHSLDHDTRNYFRPETQIAKWLESSDTLLKKLDLSPVGFRSPLGIKTPGLNNVLKKNKTPLVLWSVRFYDTQVALTKNRINKKLSEIKAGSIILLHDTQAQNRQESFLLALEHLLIECQKKGLQFLALDKKIILNTYLEKYETF